MIGNENVIAGATIAAVGFAPIAFDFEVVGFGAAAAAGALQSSICSIQAGSVLAVMTSLRMK